jgi:hypothetical protein
MREFLTRHALSVIGVLSGFDRMIFHGTLRSLMYRAGVLGFLWRERVLLKEFKGYAQGITEEVRRRTEERSQALWGCPVEVVRSSQVKKEALAQALARKRGVVKGWAAILSAQELSPSYEVGFNPEAGKLDVRIRLRRCVHYYHYLEHPEYGWMHVRVQTYFPFKLQVYLNGREWLGRQMARAGIDYIQRDNSFPWISDVEGAQALMDRQLERDWPRLLEGIRRKVHPLHERIFASCPQEYYWTLKQGEWATDVMFESPECLERLMPGWLHHGLISFRSTDILRFLGHRLPAHGGVSRHTPVWRRPALSSR